MDHRPAAEHGHELAHELALRISAAIHRNSACASGALHNEAQAHLVDDWFAGTGRVASETLTTAQSGPRPMDPGNPYFGYIENNLQAGVM